ncbi:MAG: hypothetical protein MCS20_01350 [Candidatus Phytoplasma mali]|nr:hypothetical protein [Candidatus Phytoplasma australiense]MCG7202044.1 hypothetical protein [Candidatus Phytoplasma mali]
MKIITNLSLFTSPFIYIYIYIYIYNYLINNVIFGKTQCKPLTRGSKIN